LQVEIFTFDDGAPVELRSGSAASVRLQLWAAAVGDFPLPEIEDDVFGFS
jgi:hypothetical protein